MLCFDSDYGRNLDEKYHGEMIAGDRSIQPEFVGTPESPFAIAKKENGCIFLP